VRHHGSHRGAGEPEAAPLPGVLSFRPRLPAILLLLTVTVLVAAYRITREGEGKAVERMAREALAAYGEWSAEAGAGKGDGAGPKDPAAALSRIVGRPVALPVPGGEGDLRYLDARKRPVGKVAGGLLRIDVGGARYLLLVARDPGGAEPSPPDRFFSGEPWLSGERGGLSFVFWRRAGLAWCLVSGRPLAETFATARERFHGASPPGGGG
jgi:hypothetical protein